MKIEEYGTSEDKTRIELCELLERLANQLTDIAETVRNISTTLYNEEYE